MKKLHLILLLSVTCFLCNIMLPTCYAAGHKGKVAAVVQGNTEICGVLEDILPDLGEDACDVKGQISNLVFIKGDLPEMLEPERKVILNVQDTGKFMTKVIFLNDSDTKLNDIASALIKEEGGIIWYNEKGGLCILLLLKPENEFLPSVGDDASLKVKRNRRIIEGC
ncbi:MAG: hypothetical protein AVO38_03150 [delta proteobacterium ML8_D]|jgi:hypothetical protein|nr:MAG: hypothetical protein AVO38_03150 [delta proteobacterium ML8_D]